MPKAESNCISEMPVWAAPFVSAGSDEIAADLKRFSQALGLAVRGLRFKCRDTEPDEDDFEALDEIAWQVVRRALELQRRLNDEMAG